MKINKYIKGSSNKYKVIIDDETYTLYDDVIIKYNLLMKNEIDEKTFNEMINTNNELLGYYESIRYITKKLRSELEIYEYLHKKEIPEDIIKKNIKKLKENGFINDEVFLKCYISDQLNLTNHGPLKIKKSLIKLGIDESLVNDAINNIDDDLIYNKINNYIDKKIRLNHNSSSYMLKVKIQNDLINLGYDKSLINDILNMKEINDDEVYKNEYEKIKNKLSKKYSGEELEYKIKAKMYAKGFRR